MTVLVDDPPTEAYVVPLTSLVGQEGLTQAHLAKAVRRGLIPSIRRGQGSARIVTASEADRLLAAGRLIRLFGGEFPAALRMVDAGIRAPEEEASVA